MIDFTYQNPTKMVFGQGVEDQVGTLLLEHGKKVLFHYGSGSIKQNGLYDRVVASLHASGLDVVELGGVVPNPLMSTVYEGIELVRTQQVDVILAVGGGSVIDSAKAIAMGARYEGDAWDFFAKGTVPTSALPVGVVLTIAAAGSESSNATVVTNDTLGLKRSCRHEILRPVFAVMNPAVTMTLSPYQTAVGAIDMLGHVIERYFTNTTHVDLIDRMSEGLMKTVIDQAKLLKEDPKNVDARAEIMLAGALAHNGSLGVGREEDWACHVMEYEVTQTCGVAHGHGLAMLYPAWMRYVVDQDVNRFAMFAHEVFGIPYHEDPRVTAFAGIESLEAFYHELGIDTKMSSCGITAADIEPMAASCTNQGQRVLGNFVPLTKDDVIRIYHAAL